MINDNTKSFAQSHSLTSDENTHDVTRCCRQQPSLNERLKLSSMRRFQKGKTGPTPAINLIYCFQYFPSTNKRTNTTIDRITRHTGFQQATRSTTNPSFLPHSLFSATTLHNSSVSRNRKGGRMIYAVGVAVVYTVGALA